MGMFAIRRPPTVLLRESQVPLDGQPASPGIKRHPPAMGGVGLYTAAASAAGLLAAKEKKARREESMNPLDSDRTMAKMGVRTDNQRVQKIQLVARGEMLRLYKCFMND